MAEIIQFPVIHRVVVTDVLEKPPRKLIPIKFADPAAAKRSRDKVGEYRLKYMRKCMEDANRHRTNPEYQSLLIWAVDDYLRWLGK